MKLHCLGGSQEVGKSCFLLDTGELRVVFDCGMKVHDHNEGPVIPGKVDAGIITHAHLDHSGCAPLLYKHNTPKTFCTYPTLPIMDLLLADSEKIARSEKKQLPYTRKNVKQLEKHVSCLGYKEDYKFKEGSKFRFLDAGHIPGSAQVLFKHKKKKVLYTGDFNTGYTRLHPPAKPVKADVLIIESTYAQRDHEPRKKVEKDFCAEVEKALDNGLTVLVPAFAVGRTQEVIEVLRARTNAKVFVNGMGKKVCDIIMDYPDYIKGAHNFAKAMKNTTVMRGRRDEKKAFREPSVIVSTAGMLGGGPMLNYVNQCNENNSAVVLLTGYQVEGTNGHSLVNEGKMRFDGIEKSVRLPVKHFDFSAHSGRIQLFDYVDAVKPEKVVCVHGEACNDFAEELKHEGYDAYAPVIGDKIEL
jgi:putative mRNA 3-end processing factor